MFRTFFRKDVQQELSYRLNLLWQVGSLSFFVVLLLFMSGMVTAGADPAAALYDGDYFAFAVLGFALADALWSSQKSVAGAVRYDQVVGTLEAMTASATPVWKILLFSGAYPLTRAALRLGLVLALSVLLGADLPGADLLRAVPVILLSLVVFCALGLVSASMILVFKRGDPVTAILGGLTFLFSGALYPVAAIPEPVRFIAHLIPVTYAIDSVRALVLQGAAWREVLPDVLALAGFAAAAIVAAWASVRAATRFVQRHGVRAY